MDVNHERRGLIALSALVVSVLVLLAVYWFWLMPSKQQAAEVPSVQPAACEAAVSAGGEYSKTLEIDNGTVILLRASCREQDAVEVVAGGEGHGLMYQDTVTWRPELGVYEDRVTIEMSTVRVIYIYLFVNGKLTGEPVTVNVRG